MFLLLAGIYSEETGIYLNKNINYDDNFFKKGDRIDLKNNYSNIYYSYEGIFIITGRINNKSIRTTSQSISFNKGSSIPDFLQNDYWIMDYYYDFISSRDEKILFKKESYWTEEWVQFLEDGIKPWNYFFSPTYMRFGENFFYTDSNLVNQNDLYALCFLDRQNDSEYYLKVPFSQIGFTKNDYLACVDEFVKINNAKKDSQLILIVDGDYLSFYLDSKDKESFLFRLARTNEETFNLIKDYTKKNYENLSYDLSKIKYPKHADGSCDYDVSKAQEIKNKEKEEPTTIVEK